MSIHLVFITYNRLHYTKKSLSTVLSDKNEDFILTIWDNASTDGTREYLKTIKDPRVTEMVLSKKNVGQIEAVNRVWSSSSADLLGKLDNDCLVTPGWTRILSKAHGDVDRLGAVACWHFFEDDFDFAKAKNKIHEFNGHKILRHPWICGTGFLMKRQSYLENGPISGDMTTGYWIRLAQRGMINGFYYPLVYQEHMDDPKSTHSMLKDEKSFQNAIATTVSLNVMKLRNHQEQWHARNRIVNTLLCDPWEVKYYTGWRKTLKKLRTQKDLLKRALA